MAAASIVGGAVLIITSPTTAGTSAVIGTGLVVSGFSHFAYTYQTYKANKSSGMTWNQASNWTGLTFSWTFTPNWGNKKQTPPPQTPASSPVTPSSSQNGGPLIASSDPNFMDAGWPNNMQGQYGPNDSRNFQSINTATGVATWNQTPVYFADPLYQGNYPRISEPLPGNPNTNYYVNQIGDYTSGGTTIIYETPTLYKAEGVNYQPNSEFFKNPEIYNYFRTSGTYSGVGQTSWLYYRVLINR